MLTNKIKISLNALYSDAHPVMVNPVGVTALAGHLREVFPQTVEVSVQCSLFDTLPQMIQRIRSQAPDIIGVSLQMGSHEQMERFMSALEGIRGAFVKPPLIVLGNVLATFAPEVLLERYPDALMVLGEGESALEGLVRQVAGGGRAFAQVPNLIYRQDGRVIRTAREVFDLGRIAMPSFDFLHEMVRADGHVWTEASRGCNSHCTFCSRYPVRMADWAPIDVGHVLEKMTRMHRDYGVKHFRFTDDDFMGTGSPEGYSHAAAIAQGIISRRLKVTFDISTRVKAVFSLHDTEEANERKLEYFRLLRRAGLSQVYLGVESGSARQLKRFAKGVVVEENLKGVAAVLGLGLQVVLGFITIDFLMDIDELEENIAFLDKVGAFDPSKAVFVSDPLVTLRAQAGSAFVTMLDKQGLLCDRNEFCLTYNGLYRDPRVGEVAALIEDWKKDFFSFSYVLKNRVSKLSMEKNNSRERVVLEGFLHEFKLLDYEYLVGATRRVKQDHGTGLKAGRESLRAEHDALRLDIVSRLKKDLFWGNPDQYALLQFEIDKFMEAAAVKKQVPLEDGDLMAAAV